MEDLGFPVVTYILATIMIGSFLFTSTSSIYIQELGFVPANIKPYSFITYAFLHLDALHLFGNLIMLFICGLAIERFVGKRNFLLIFLLSVLIAPFFDIISRFLFLISPEIPLIGSSGGIFGLLFVASMLKPYEKLNIGLVLGSLIPFVEYPFYFITIGPSLLMLLIFFVVAVFVMVYKFIRFTLPLYIAMFIFLLSWLASFVIKYPLDVSFFAHIGGVIGGLISLFFLKRVK